MHNNELFDILSKEWMENPGDLEKAHILADLAYDAQDYTESEIWRGLATERFIIHKDPRQCLFNYNGKLVLWDLFISDLPQEIINYLAKYHISCANILRSICESKESYIDPEYNKASISYREFLKSFVYKKDYYRYPGPSVKSLLSTLKKCLNSACT